MTILIIVSLIIVSLIWLAIVSLSWFFSKNRERFPDWLVSVADFIWEKNLFVENQYCWKCQTELEETNWDGDRTCRNAKCQLNNYGHWIIIDFVTKVLSGAFFIWVAGSAVGQLWMLLLFSCGMLSACLWFHRLTIKTRRSRESVNIKQATAVQLAWKSLTFIPTSACLLSWLIFTMIGG